MVVHRVELGTWEREHLADAMKGDDLDDAVRLVLDVVNSLAMPAALAAVGYGVYLGMTHWGSLLDPLKERAEAIKAAAEAFSAEQEAARAAGASVPSGQPPTGYTSPNPGAPQEPGRGWTFAAMLAGALGGGTGLG